VHGYPVSLLQTLVTTDIVAHSVNGISGDYGAAEFMEFFSRGTDAERPSERFRRFVGESSKGAGVFVAGGLHRFRRVYAKGRK